MDEKMIERHDEVEIDLQRIFDVLLSKAWLIALVAIICAVAVFLGTLFFVTPQYQSAAMFYVNNSSLSLGEASLSISSADISASRGLVKTYIVILNTREVLNDVIDYAGVNYTYGQLKSMISAEAVDATEVFQVVVTSPDPAEAEVIADAISYILPKRITNIIDGTSAKVVDSAVMPSSPSSPSYIKNTMIGFVVGLLLMAAILVIRELLDITIRTEDNITRDCKHPVLSVVPDMGIGVKERRPKEKTPYEKAAPVVSRKAQMVGPNISFAAAEAYKLLRTKIQFSFADEGNCRIIGVSSALSGEGKSLTAVNLAFTMSELGKRVLLIDCDLRRPSVFEKLPIKRFPGLSDYLTGQHGNETIFQNCGLKGRETAFHVVSSGRIPPNPMEMLSSAKMEKMLAALRDKYDYIILDLPPVGEVGDALVVSKLTDGMLVVVRQNHSDRIVMKEAIHQLEFVNAKILGIVFNCISETGNSYGNRYYKRYYKKHAKRYYKDAEARGNYASGMAMMRDQEARKVWDQPGSGHTDGQ